MSDESIQPFRIHITDNAIADLHRRLELARLPARGPHNTTWTHGITLERMQQFIASWRKLDWRKQEAKMNSVPHFKTRVEDIDLHFMHQRSSHKNAIPLILCHGWPGSFHEFVHLMEPLAEPKEGQAFHVVAPSHPGYTFSSAPSTTKWQMDDTARIYDILMQRLGYPKYAAQGGDWGSITARLLGFHYPDRCLAVHLNFCPARPPAYASWLTWFPSLLPYVPLFTPLERQRIQQALHWNQYESAYTAMHCTKPTTVAFALNDSPVGLLAWIGEKFEAWNEHGGESPVKPLSDEVILTSISLYWFTGCINTSFLPYKQNNAFVSYVTPQYWLPNAAHSVFPGEIVITPERLVNRTGNFVWRKEAERGGHFASLEVPEIFLDHLREAIPVMWRRTIT